MLHNRQSLKGVAKQWNTASMVDPTVSSWLQGSKCTSRQKSRLKCGQKVLPWFLGNQQDVRFLGDRGHPDISRPSLKKRCIFAPMQRITVSRPFVPFVWKHDESTTNLISIHSSSVERMSEYGRSISQLFPPCSRSIYHLRQPQRSPDASRNIAGLQVPKPRQRLLIRHLQPMGWKQLSGCKTDYLTVLSAGKQNDALSIRQHITNLEAEGVVKFNKGKQDVSKR